MEPKYKKVSHVAVTTDPRQSTIVIVAVLNDGSVWCSQGIDEWVELQGIPGTEKRAEQDGEVTTATESEE